MKIITLALWCLLAAPMPAAAQISTALDLNALKAVVEEVGYIVRSNPDSFTIRVQTEKFEVPMQFGISNSKNYIWVTVNLGASKLTGELALALLKRGRDVQPTQFWISSQNQLMVSRPVENHNVTPAWIKKTIDGIAADVVNTTDIWQDLSPKPNDVSQASAMASEMRDGVRVYIGEASAGAQLCPAGGDCTVGN